MMMIDMNIVQQYNGKIEGFETKGNCQSSPELSTKVIDTNKEHEDNSQTSFSSMMSNEVQPHNDMVEVHHLMESGDSLIRNKAPFDSESAMLNKDESCLLETSCGAICSTKNTKAPCCLLYTSPSPRDKTVSRMPSSA